MPEIWIPPGFSTTKTRPPDWVAGHAALDYLYSQEGVFQWDCGGGEFLFIGDSLMENVLEEARWRVLNGNPWMLSTGVVETVRRALLEKWAAIDSAGNKVRGGKGFIKFKNDRSGSEWLQYPGITFNRTAGAGGGMYGPNTSGFAIVNSDFKMQHATSSDAFRVDIVCDNTRTGLPYASALELLAYGSQDGNAIGQIQLDGGAAETLGYRGGNLRRFGLKGFDGRTAATWRVSDLQVTSGGGNTFKLIGSLSSGTNKNSWYHGFFHYNGDVFCNPRCVNLGWSGATSGTYIATANVADSTIDSWFSNADARQGYSTASDQLNNKKVVAVINNLMINDYTSGVSAADWLTNIQTLITRINALCGASGTPKPLYVQVGTWCPGDTNDGAKSAGYKMADFQAALRSLTSYADNVMIIDTHQRLGNTVGTGAAGANAAMKKLGFQNVHQNPEGYGWLGRMIAQSLLKAW